MVNFSRKAINNALPWHSLKMSWSYRNCKYFHVGADLMRKRMKNRYNVKHVLRREDGNENSNRKQNRIFTVTLAM